MKVKTSRVKTFQISTSDDAHDWVKKLGFEARYYMLTNNIPGVEGLLGTQQGITRKSCMPRNLC